MASRTAKKGKNLPPAPGIMVKPSSKGEAPTQFPGKAVMEESKQRSKGFKSGGGVGSESVAEGTAQPGQRLDKRARRASGGSVPSMRGRSPLSAASSTSMPSTKTNH